MFPLDTYGLIESGESAGHYVRIEHDVKDTGGYYILVSMHPAAEIIDLKHAAYFDDWVQSEELVEKFIGESEWRVRWMGPGAEGLTAL